MFEKKHGMVWKVWYYLLPVLSILLFLGIWLFAATTMESGIPSPVQVFERFLLLLERPISKVSILGHIGASLGRVLKALGYAVLIGVPFGLLIGWSKTFSALFKPLFEMIRPIPPIAWIPLITVWFGVDELSKIIIVFLGAVMPIVVNTYTGVAMIPSLYTNVGKVFGANGGKLLWDIILPGSFQAIFAGIRTAISVGWMVVLAAEMISARSGLGFLIIRGSDSDDIALTMVSMVFIGIIGAALTVIFDFLERRLCPWAER